MITADDWMGMYHMADDRANKAEAEVERLQKVYSITNESWKKLQVENKVLKIAVETTRGVILTNGMSQILLDDLRKAVEDVDKMERKINDI